MHASPKRLLLPLFVRPLLQYLPVIVPLLPMSSVLGLVWLHGFPFFSEIRLAGSTWTSWITSAGSTGRRELPVNLDTNLDVELYPICWLFWYRSIAFGMQWYWRKGQLHSIGWLDSEYKATDTHSNDGFINLHTVSTNIAPEKCKVCIFVDLITWLMRKW